MTNFEIIPAIDLLDQKVVRLAKGKRDQVTIYSDDPVAFARQFENAGATRLHVVDLNGAFDGEFANLALVKAICGSTSMRVELGGGIRSLADAETIWEAGVHDAIIGTRAVEDEEFTRQILEQYPDRTIIGVDAKDGMVATRGWVEASDKTAIDFARKMHGLGCRRIIYTDIDTDGMLTGPNLEAQKAMAESLPELEVVASGGISTTEDFEALIALGCSNIVGAITGRAVYDGRIDLASAVQRVRVAG